MHTQEALIHEEQQPREESIIAWLSALRDELGGRGLNLGVPRQFSGQDVLVGYRLDVASGNTDYVLECKLQDEHSVVMRVSFIDAKTQELVLSYRVNLGATMDLPQSALARRLTESRNRIPLIATYFDQARTTGTLLH